MPRKIHPPNPKTFQDHPYVRMRIPGKRTYAHIDQMMEPIIQQCWGRGIHTMFCCQGDVGPLCTPENNPMDNELAVIATGYVKFKSERDAQEFMLLMSPERIVWKGALRHKYDPEGKYAAAQVNGLWWIWEEDCDVVRFPHIAIPTIVSVLTDPQSARDK